MTITIMQGNELSETQIDLMNRQRIIEYGENTKDFKKNEQESTFFFLTENDRVRAFGMLKPVVITYQQQDYRISGIGNIIAIEKGTGCGKTLMHAIRDDLHRKNVTGIGFCRKHICEFYVRCGFQVEHHLADRFRYQYAAQDGHKEKLAEPLGVIAFEGGDRLLGKLCADDDLIYTNVPFW